MARTTERDVPITQLNIRGIIINPDAGGESKTVYASDSGCIFINKEDAGNVTYTLPAVADCEGKWFWFYNAEDDVELIIAGTTTGKMYGPGSEGAEDNMTSSTSAIGDSCMVIGDGTYYYFFPIFGTWA